MDEPVFARLTPAELLQATGGEAVTAFPDELPPVRVWTDTRTLQAGDFFLPLKGENFDGHDYLQVAFEAGAEGAFVAKQQFERNPEWRQYPGLIAVPDVWATSNATPSWPTTRPGTASPPRSTLPELPSTSAANRAAQRSPQP